MKNKLILIFITFFALCSALVILSFAHPGKTDEYGGHYDRETGEYHYHHGYPAHQHPDGMCPYNFDDQTDHSSGSSYYSGDDETYDYEHSEQTTNTTTTVPDNSHKNKTNDSSSFIDIIENIVNWIFLILLLLGFAFYIGIIIYGIFFDNKKK